MSGFDARPHLVGETLELRALAPAHADDLYEAARDEETWAGHPARDRWRREVFAPYFAFLLAAGGAVVVIDRASGRIIGCSRYYTAPDMPGTISVGFTFLNHRWWGGRTNFELKRLMLGHAFARYPAIWFHIDPANIRSQTATRRLGAVDAGEAILDLAGKPAAWKVYRLDRAAWEQVCAERAGAA